ncbi:Cupin domain-containing protein [Tindallia magadiensis]|uniref:Cupin domain-containing protein n=1 Tax=Tindallia magadiensis TaxID=69895 RepID=A0A1I3H222_9FIRM|nr:cupin domain-containing protein [Tindallia magadiensis]SFI29686.1 Cupin domain-containing protein [Tindallia magadiensis]
MVKRPEDMRKESIHELKGGRGTIELEHFFEEEDFCGKGRLYGISIIHPGDSIGMHRHEGEQEAYFILEGEAHYNDNGREVQLNPGDFTLCRDGESHAIANQGDTDLKYVAMIMYT